MSGTVNRSSEAAHPRRRLSAEERRESILEAANEVFGEHGYEHVRIDDIAAAAGISKALIYEHFRSKQELYMRADEPRRARDARPGRGGGLGAGLEGAAADGERGRGRFSVRAGAAATRSTCSCAT